MSNIEIYKNEETTEIFKSLGSIDINTTKEIPIFVKNIGKTRLINVSIATTYPDTIIKGNSIYPILEPGEIGKYLMVWSPGNKSMEIFKSGKKRDGGIIISAKEVIE